MSNPERIKQDYFRIEEILQKRREQMESVMGKKTPFRVEYRFGHGDKRYQYFETLEDAKAGNDHIICGYSIFGNAWVKSPISKQIQVKGPRGGWKKFKEDAK